MSSQVLGYEWDEDFDNGFRPPGSFRLSRTIADVPQLLLDYGSTYGAGTATHSLTLYRHPSGALVFGAGTCQWSWGLDGNHDGGTPNPDTRVRQATVNLFADMGVQPATLRPGLVAATASTDTTPPASTVASPPLGASVQLGTVVTVSGTAVDWGGGVVGGVEVSFDAGATWHPASGRESWSYAWTPSVLGAVTIVSRATDDSGNIEIPSSLRGDPLTVIGPAATSIWDSSATPATPSHNDIQAVELGVRFRSDVSGSITGLRFYKGSANTGTHVGHLWTNTGVLLATATFANETASGWQQVDLNQPVTINANTTYVASYHTNVGRYAVTRPFFAGTGVDNPPLHALMDGFDGRNGVYVYGASAFPSQTYQSTNYWVDVVFAPELIMWRVA